jgi:glutamate decarboxylase
MVLAQYYNMLRFGKGGYRKIMQNILSNARYLGKKLKDSGKFIMVNDAEFLPIIAFSVKGGPGFTVYDISAKVREKGWIMPAYTLPPNADKIAVCRVVVKENFSRDMADMLYEDLMWACDELSKVKPTPRKKPKKERRIC